MTSRNSLAPSFLRAIWSHQSPLRGRLQPFHRSLRGKPTQHLLGKNYTSRVLRRNYSGKPQGGTPNPTPNLGSPEPQSISARLKRLTREYGWTVIGVYLALTVADLPLCFLAVKYIGAERISYAEHVVVGGAKDLISRVLPGVFDEKNELEVEEEVKETKEEEKSGEPTFWTKVGLMFIVHKSFIFVRVPLTAAVTPKVVKTLRKWGYNIGQRKPKSK